MHNLLARTQWSIFLSSWLTVFSRISCFFPEICRLISSAYKTVLKLEAFTMSLIYTRNNKGPTTDHWGTPHATFIKEDLVSPILVHWNLLSSAGCGYPYLRAGCGNSHCFTWGCGAGAGWTWCRCGAGAGWEIPHAGKWVLSQITWTWSAWKW